MTARKQRSTTERGYDGRHKAERERRVAVHCAGNPCAIGGEPLWQPVAMLDLAHDHANGSGYLPGLACRFHNRQEGGRRGNLVKRLAPVAKARRW